MNCIIYIVRDMVLEFIYYCLKHVRTISITVEAAFLLVIKAEAPAAFISGPKEVHLIWEGEPLESIKEMVEVLGLQSVILNPCSPAIDS